MNQLALPALHQYRTEMEIAKYSPVTISDRIALLQRLAHHLDKPLLDATEDDLRGFQARFAHLAPASVDIYSRHMKAFYDWAARRRLLDRSPAENLIIPKVPKGRPHPTTADELRIIFACTRGVLRLVYVLAAFAGLRRGEICRIQRRDLDLAQPLATVLVHGKGGKERIVPLLAPVVAELYEYGLPRAGWVVKRDGRPYAPGQLSIDSHNHLRQLRLSTTLHSMRGTFATAAAQATHDPLFVRDLLGHESVATTEIYMASTMADAHARLALLAEVAESFLTPGHAPLRAINGGAQ